MTALPTLRRGGAFGARRSAQKKPPAMFSRAVVFQFEMQAHSRCRHFSSSGASADCVRRQEVLDRCGRRKFGEVGACVASGSCPSTGGVGGLGAGVTGVASAAGPPSTRALAASWCRRPRTPRGRPACRSWSGRCRGRAPATGSRDRRIGDAHVVEDDPAAVTPEPVPDSGGASHQPGCPGKPGCRGGKIG